MQISTKKVKTVNGPYYEVTGFDGTPSFDTLPVEYLQCAASVSLSPDEKSLIIRHDLYAASDSSAVQHSHVLRIGSVYSRSEFETLLALIDHGLSRFAKIQAHFAKLNEGWAGCYTHIIVGTPLIS